jgi:hypothetical protein
MKSLPKISPLAALTIALLTGCSITEPGQLPETRVISSPIIHIPKATPSTPSAPATPSTPVASTIETETVKVNNDLALLEQGISRPAQTLQLQSVGGLNVEGLGVEGLGAKAFIGNPWTFELIAKVEAPITPKGISVRATHISFNGKYAIVTYNREGATFAGALEVYDISDSNHPIRISQALFDDMDANVVSSPDEDLTSISKGRLYVGGARSIKGTGHKRPAVLSEFSIQGGQLGTEIKSIELDGYSTNSIARYGPLVMTSSGNADCDDPSDPLRGGTAITRSKIFETGSPLESLKLKTFCRAQAVAVHHAGYFETSYLAALEAGDHATLDVYDLKFAFKNDPAQILKTNRRTIQIGEVNPVDNKNTMDIDRGLVWVATGNKGVKAFNLGTASSIPAYTLSTDDTGTSLSANSVSIDGDTAYVAYGSDGVYVARIPQCDDPTKLSAQHVNCQADGMPFENKNLDWYGKFSDVGGSANFAAAKDCLIFIASGEGGLRIVRRVK